MRKPTIVRRSFKLPRITRADIMVNSSRIGNMPHCLIEALAAGLPVVTTPFGGIPYFAQHRVNGLCLFAAPFFCVGGTWVVGRFQRNRGPIWGGP